MEIQNKQFGKIEFKDDRILEFNEGIMGFEYLNKFILVSEQDSFFFWLTSVDEPEIIFPLFPMELLQEETQNEEDYVPYGIVKLDKDPQNITINLKAPVYINQTEKQGFQKIIDQDDMPLDYPLFVKN